MATTEITYFFSNEGTRNDVRMRVVDAFSQEIPGTQDEASKYIYYVEELNDGNWVYLQRPAWLHNGFDFLVCVTNMNYAAPGARRRNAPTHDDFYDDLMCKKEENPAMYARFYRLLRKVYECYDVTEDEIRRIHFNSGLDADHILKVIKWLFIEQDIRYWNNSGRHMTWGIVPEP